MSRGFGSTFGAGTGDVLVSRFNTTPANNFSFSVWYYKNGLGNLGAGKIADNNNLGSGGIQLCPDNNIGSNTAMKYSHNNGGAGNYATFTDNGLGVWQHLVVCDQYNTTTLPTIYLNGKPMSVGGTILAGAATSVNMCLGNNSSASRNFDGMITHFAAWNGILLSASDASALAGGVSPLSVRPDCLAMYLPLDGVNKPEPDLMLGNASSISGTRLGTSEPPVESWYGEDDFLVMLNQIVAVGGRTNNAWFSLDGL